MDNKEIKKIGKKELLEILLSQAKRIEELENELSRTKKKLESKKVLIDECGNIADSTVRLCGIFELAQETAEMYLSNIKEKCKKIEDSTKKECMLRNEKMIAETEEICKKREKEADDYLKKIKLEVKELKKKTDNKKKVSSVKKKSSTDKVKVTSEEKSKNINKVRLKKVKKEI